jgi:hypothetical protein
MRGNIYISEKIDRVSKVGRIERSVCFRKVASGAWRNREAPHQCAMSAVMDVVSAGGDA